jgi:hypothetical protein
MVFLPFLASCGGRILQVDAQRGTPTPVSKESLRKVFEAMDQITDMPVGKDACISTIVPEKPVPSGYSPGKCSDDPAKCLEECRKGTGGSCYALALLIEKSGEITVDYPDRLHLKACELSIVSACTNHAARSIERQPEDKGIQKCTADTFEKTCALDDAWGCAMYAMLLVEGKGREKDLDSALATAEKACKYGDDVLGCRDAKKIIELIKRMQKLEPANRSNN